jgi:hypothetical protein
MKVHPTYTNNVHFDCTLSREIDGEDLYGLWCEEFALRLEAIISEFQYTVSVDQDTKEITLEYFTVGGVKFIRESTVDTMLLKETNELKDNPSV